MTLLKRHSFTQLSMGFSAVLFAAVALGCSSPGDGNNTTNTADTSQASVNHDGERGSLEFSQEELPYAFNALEPHVDARTMEIHYSRHHAAYVKNANAALDEENIPYDSAEELFDNISRYSNKARNNAGGAWNHSFFWKSMKAPSENNAPTGALAEAINDEFGSFEAFKEQFAAAATGQFGSGWAWLVNDNGTLKIGSTPNQDNPLMDDVELSGTPLLGLDVWEHAYYLHYQNMRGDYVTNWWNVVDWDFVASQFE